MVKVYNQEMHAVKHVYDINNNIIYKGYIMISSERNLKHSAIITTSLYYSNYDSVYLIPFRKEWDSSIIRNHSMTATVTGISNIYYETND